MKALRALGSIAFGIFLTGCSTPHLEGANEAGGMAVAIYRQDAFNLADQHCRQYGKIVRIGGVGFTKDGLADANVITFDCVIKR